MAKKIKIDVDFSEDNNLIGISCHKKDYWLAFQINESLKLNLRRLTDFPFYHSKIGELLNYSLFHDHHQEQLLDYYLITNYNQQSPLFPELKTTDFFILIQGKLMDDKKSDLLSLMRSIKGVLTAFHPETGKLKEFNNFLSDLELHMTTVEIRD